MASNKKILNDVAKQLDLNYNGKSCLVYGVYNGYHLLIKGSGFFDNTPHIVITFCVKSHDPSVVLQAFLPNYCQMQEGTFKRKILIRNSGNRKHNVKRITEFLNNFTALLKMNNFSDCDEYGTELNAQIYILKGEYVFLSQASADNLRYSLKEQEMQEALKKENYVLGFIGAIIGALIASIIVFFVAQIGYISNISSALLGIGLVYGYKFKGVHISKISAVICIILSVIFSYLTFRFDTAVTINNAMGIGLSNAFLNSREIIKLSGDISTYYRNLILLASPGIIGTIVAVVYELSAQKKQFEIMEVK